MQLDGLAAERPLVAQLELPPEAPILAGILRVGLQLVPRLLLLGVAFAYFGVRPGRAVLLAPLAVVAIVVLGTALGVALAQAARPRKRKE